MNAFANFSNIVARIRGGVQLLPRPPIVHIYGRNCLIVLYYREGTMSYAQRKETKPESGPTGPTRPNCSTKLTIKFIFRPNQQRKFGTGWTMINHFANSVLCSKSSISQHVWTSAYHTKQNILRISKLAAWKHNFDAILCALDPFHSTGFSERSKLRLRNGLVV